MDVGPAEKGDGTLTRTALTVRSEDIILCLQNSYLYLDWGDLFEIHAV